MTKDKRRLGDIEADLDQNRERMGKTLDALQHRLSTESFVERSRSYLRATGGDEFVFNLGRSVRRNPVPLSILGLGIGWLMLSSSEQAGRAIARNKPDLSRGDGQGSDSQGSKSQGSTNEGSSVRDAAGKARRRTKSAAQNLHQGAEQAAGSGQAGLSHATDRARRGTAYVADGARRGTANMAGGARRGASRAGQATRRGGARLADGADYMRREQPLVSSALGLALGAVLAASLPRSSSENRAMGSKRDDFVASAREAGQEKAGQAQSVAESAAEAAREAAKSETERQRGTRDHQSQRTAASGDQNHER